MKITGGQVYTTTEILKDFFQLEDKLLAEIDEKERYEKIYSCLLNIGAEYLGIKEFNGFDYEHFKHKESSYLIPVDIFSEMENSIAQDRKSKKVNSNILYLFKKAN